MPYRPSVPCKHPRCPALVPYGSGPYCDEHKAAHQGDRESASRRGYNSRWQKARVRYLHSHPLCVECKKQGKLTQATVVDHIVPHRGDQKLFWNESNWQPLCNPCHDKKTWNEDNNPTYKFQQVEAVILLQGCKSDRGGAVLISTGQKPEDRCPLKRAFSRN